MRKRLAQFAEAYPIERVTRVSRLLFYCALVGVVGGTAAIAFQYLISSFEHLCLDGLAGYRPKGPGGERHLFHPTDTPFRPWVLVLLPAVGGFLSALIVTWLAPESEGHGTDAAIQAYHRGVSIRGRVPLVKMLSSSITLGTAGSAGKEGPIAQIGAGFGSLLAGWLRLPPVERRVLMIAGLSAGVGAMFQAPLAGALFAAEVLYREMDLEVEVIVPAVISSIVSYAVYTGHFGARALFVTPPFSFESGLELGPYLLLALAVALGAKVFVSFFRWMSGHFHRLALHRVLRPALGGLGCGAVGYFAPEAIGSGYGVVQEAFAGELGAGALLGIAGLKILSTSLTVGSGGSGGVFGPSVVIGACIGGAVGAICQSLMPGISPHPGAFVVVGMAGFFAAAANTPISTIIMVSEITGNYQLLVPSMWVCIIAFLLVRRSTVYESQVPSRLDSPVHLGEYMGGVLHSLRVSDVLDRGEAAAVVTVKASTPLATLLELFSETGHDAFPIVDDEGRLIGIVDDRAMRETIGTEGLVPLIVAQDLAEKAPLLHPSESLDSAMRKMVSSRHDELVVVDDTDERRIVGTLSRRDLIATYDARIQDDLAARETGGAML